jgi:hypothetical protein
MNQTLNQEMKKQQGHANIGDNNPTPGENWATSSGNMITGNELGRGGAGQILIQKR